ncbi:MAG: DUF1553 domain-containing protein [Planctomycetaceae bacterium]|nr:DUF1553 domain-containing protein [Planctomycetaceae bacterium]
MLLHTETAIGGEPGGHFDNEVAPLLVRRCLNCHNSSTNEGGLNLSRSADAMAGGESGAAILPGNPQGRLLWQRIDADEMPPKEHLPSSEKELLRKWIADGARWGSDPIDPFRFSTQDRGGYDWWSLQPVTSPAVPNVSDASWPRNELDRFVLAELESKQLAPSEQADGRTLLRRLYFDLIGLPPLLKEENGKLKEELFDIEIDLATFGDHPEAYTAVVDRLLQSPHYGERWARHWLDVIRFGESQGFERNRIRENAWRYRDWVINALNNDLPYDEFVRQQIAGDVLYPDDLDALLATGFLVCGTWDQVGHNEGSPEMRKAVRQDDLEDLVAAFGQSFLGLTTNCARCHDHKFDPISQREYYQLAAALGGVTQQEKERQGITARPDSEAYRLWTNRRDTLRRELTIHEKLVRDKYGDSGAGNPIEGLQILYLPDETIGQSLPDQSRVDPPLNLVSGGQHAFASTGPATRLVTAAKTTNEFSIEVWLTPAKDKQSGPARIVTLSKDSARRNFTFGQDGNRFDLRFRTTKTDQNGLPSLTTPNGTVTTQKTHVVYTFDLSGNVSCYVDGKHVAERQFGGDLSNWDDTFQLALGDELTGNRRWEGKLHFIGLYNKALSANQVARNFASGSRDVRAGESLEELFVRASAGERSRFQQLRQELQRLEMAEPAVPFDGVAHVIIPVQPPVFHVLARGDYRNPGDVVSPAGLDSLSRAGLPAEFGLSPDAPEADRRTKLATWVTDARNPLTSRVLVNRLWHYHFGQGIVDTPSDFGFAGGRPSHPELLDWLAQKFVSEGWKIKPLHRLIVTSATWRQASNVRNPAAQETDADNRLLWRANARRLDGESTRDAMLAVSGALNRKQGGPGFRDVAVKLGNNHEFTDPTGEFNEEVNRRTIYRLWARSGNNPLLESLDCPDPSVMLPRRPQTITPVQSLSLLNSRFVEQCAAELAKQTQREAGGRLEQQVVRMYRRTFGRTPQPMELELSGDFAEKRGLDQLGLVLLNTNEFLFVE